MAYTLKSTGPAAKAKQLLAVDQDGTTVGLWTTPGAARAGAVGAGITNIGSSPPAAVSTTWKGATRGAVRFTDNGDLLFTSPPALSSPLAFVLVIKSAVPANGVPMVLGSATAGGALDGSGPHVEYTSASGKPVMRTVGAGAAVSLVNSVPASGNSFTAVMNDESSGNNDAYFSLEAGTITAADFTLTDPSFNFSNVFAKVFGYNSSPGFVGDVVLMGFFASLTLAEAAAIHADPIGALFDAAADTTAPTITVQPSAQSAIAGSAATFGFTATGTGSLTAQARKGGSNVGSPFAITTGVGATYTTPTLVIGDNGSSWDFVIHGDTAPDATTSAATLTVTAVLSITTNTLENEAGDILAEAVISKVYVIRLSDDELVLALATQSTDGTGSLTVTDVALTAAPHVVVTVTTSGLKPAGAKVYTPS